MDPLFFRYCQNARIFNHDLIKKLFRIKKQLEMDKKDVFEWEWYLIFLNLLEVINLKMMIILDNF